MIIEICLAVISICFVVLVAFLIVAVQSSRDSLKQIRKELNDLSSTGSELVNNLNELTEDLRKKSESLNFIFRFIDSFNKKKAAKSSRSGKLQKNTEQIAEIVDLVGTSVDLFQRIKRDVNKYVKSR